VPERAVRPYARKKAQVIIVTGAPGSGKTTYVREHMADGDLVWDWDEIMHAITNRPSHSECPEGAMDFVLGMRERFCAIAAHSETGIGRVWVIVSERCPLTRELQMRGATIVDLDTLIEVCAQRLRERGPGAKWALDAYLQRHRGPT